MYVHSAEGDMSNQRIKTKPPTTNRYISVSLDVKKLKPDTCKFIACCYTWLTKVFKK